MEFRTMNRNWGRTRTASNSKLSMSLRCVASTTMKLPCVYARVGGTLVGVAVLRCKRLGFHIRTMRYFERLRSNSGAVSGPCSGGVIAAPGDVGGGTLRHVGLRLLVGWSRAGVPGVVIAVGFVVLPFMVGPPFALKNLPAIIYNDPVTDW
jgi:hypothetical protein